MARTSIRERPDREEVLWPMQKACPACGQPMRLRYDNARTLVTLAGPVRLRLKIRRCERDDCARHHRPYRPEAEGAVALPDHEFGLDVIALVGRLRHREHRSVPEIHKRLREQDVAIAERSVTNLRVPVDCERWFQVLPRFWCCGMRDFGVGCSSPHAAASTRERRRL